MIIYNKIVFVYDIECFPNLFICSLKNTESKNIRTYEISNRRNDIKEIYDIFHNENIYFCGYNNKFYDDIIINYLLIGYQGFLTQGSSVCQILKNFSNEIIEAQDVSQWNAFHKYKHANIFPSFDLMSMLFSKKNRVTLKILEITMNFPKVWEYEGDFNRSVDDKDIDKIIMYCQTDIDATEEVLNRSKDAINLRLTINEEYGVNVLSKDNVNLGMELLKVKYCQATGLTFKQLKEFNTPSEIVDIGSIIFDFIKFKTPVLQKMLKELKNYTADINTKISKTFILDDLKYNLSSGGLHSESLPQIIIPEDDEILFDYDITSLYPSIILRYRILPEQLNSCFLDIYEKVYNERIEAKKNGKILESIAKKLILNGLSGNLQERHSWAYSPSSALSVRINGQLMMLMYIEQLIDIGCKIYQANTDGVLFIVKKNKLDQLNEITKSWEELTKLNFEYERFEAFYQYDVNDYIGIYEGYSKTKDPKLVKQKGFFVNEISLGKGMSAPIIAEALTNYFVKNVPVEETLHNCTDIRKFLTYQRVSKEYMIEYDKKEAMHINRYYASTNGKKLYKCKTFTVGEMCKTYYVKDKSTDEVFVLSEWDMSETGKYYNDPNIEIIKYCESKVCPKQIRKDYISMLSSGVTLYNVFDEDKPIKDRKINYGWYLSEIYKIIEPMSKQQLTLF